MHYSFRDVQGLLLTAELNTEYKATSSNNMQKEGFLPKS